MQTIPPLLIYETDNFSVVAPQRPHVDRADGGHIVIAPKVRVLDRQHLTREQAHELMDLTVLAGEAMMTVMNERGVDIGRINYQDNGNWSVFKPEGPALHYHLYGRAKSAKRQIYGEALQCPHWETHPELYADLEPLNSEDVAALREWILQKIS